MSIKEYLKSTVRVQIRVPVQTSSIMGTTGGQPPIVASILQLLWVRWTRCTSTVLTTRKLYVWSPVQVLHPSVGHIKIIYLQEPEPVIYYNTCSSDWATKYIYLKDHNNWGSSNPIGDILPHNPTSSWDQKHFLSNLLDPLHCRHWGLPHRSIA